MVFKNKLMKEFKIMNQTTIHMKIQIPLILRAYSIFLTSVQKIKKIKIKQKKFKMAIDVKNKWI